MIILYGVAMKHTLAILALSLLAVVQAKQVIPDIPSSSNDHEKEDNWRPKAEALEKRISDLEEQINRRPSDADLEPAVEVGSNPSIDVPEDCAEILALDPEARTGIHVINVGDSVNKRLISVHCDMETDGGGWTVFQRRMDGMINFYRNWQSYAEGFGFVNHEHWLGNDNLHYITSKRNYEMRVDLESFTDQTAYAHYTTFHVNSACDKYRMTLDGYSGTAGDSLAVHNNMMFSTFDRDNDRHSYNCAATFHGAWWYNACHPSNLNGQWLPAPGTGGLSNVVWRGWLGDRQSLRGTQMMVRPALLTCPV